MPEPHNPPEVIPPDEAKAHLRAAIEAQIGPDWDSPSSEWVVVSSHAYMARLNKGRTNIDFYVDYFSGEVTTEVKTVGEGQDLGRTVAWVLLFLFAVIVVVFARGMGWV